MKSFQLVNNNTSYVEPRKASIDLGIDLTGKKKNIEGGFERVIFSNHLLLVLLIYIMLQWVLLNSY